LGISVYIYVFPLFIDYQEKPDYSSDNPLDEYEMSKVMARKERTANKSNSSEVSVFLLSYIFFNSYIVFRTVGNKIYVLYFFLLVSDLF
jgi:hypothetical protein